MRPIYKMFDCFCKAFLARKSALQSQLLLTPAFFDELDQVKSGVQKQTEAWVSSITKIYTIHLTVRTGIFVCLQNSHSNICRKQLGFLPLYLILF